MKKDNSLLKIGVVGAGYWGKNHIRVVKDLAIEGKCEFVGISDLDPSKKALADRYDVSFFSDYKKLAKKIDAVIVAVPAGGLYKTAKYFLKKGKHVLTEKPFASDIKEGQDLISIAQKNKVVIMVGHIFLYTPQILKISELIQNKALGNIFYAYSQRLNLGTIRSDVNALWNFGPHDISIFIHLLKSNPVKVWATGKAYLQKKVEDVVMLSMEFADGTLVTSQLSWIDPMKIRKVTLVGDKAMLVWDDTNAETSLCIYDKGVVLPENWESIKSSDSFGEFKMKIRYGDIQMPYVEPSEPLKNEIMHFIECIREKKTPVSDGNHALEVLKILVAAQKSLQNEGKVIKIN